ncbi:cyclin H [Nematocida displodere]|uniref:Cyclin H n=1 Tax=Nematocida displodere TaxID=1805483 RepID=A0A177EB04_9MICR|nr:cyclin H [Nematocida displodere]
MADKPAEDITKEEENTMLFYYQVKMLDLCEYLKTPIQVHNTAITYFKVLFSKRKVFHYDMRNLIAACVFLALKVENTYITAEILKAKLSFVKMHLLIKYELELCQALKFNLHVSSPHLRLLGLFLLLKNKEQVRGTTEDTFQTQEIQEIDRTLDWGKSVENLKNLMLTDNYLQLNPNEVALASLTVQPSELQGLFMTDTLSAIKKIKLDTIRRESPTQQELKRIDEKIRNIQQRYEISH